MRRVAIVGALATERARRGDDQRRRHRRNYPRRRSV